MKEKNKGNNIASSGKNFDKSKFFHHWRIIALYLVLYDILAINFSYFFALWIRFDLKFSQIPEIYFEAFLKFAPFYTVFSLAVFYALRLYNSLWRFASFSELNRILAATVITTLFHIFGITVFLRQMPMTYYFIGAFMQFVLTVLVRFIYRYITLERQKLQKKSVSEHNVMIIGAGAAGLIVIRELKSSDELQALPVCVIDDNPNKWHRQIDGVPIVGGRDNILQAVKKYNVDQIMFAIPSASQEDKRDILNICKETECRLMSLPGIYQIANGDVLLSKMKPVAVEDLLGRESIKVNMEEICRYITNKTILVTGGGGSIGSELCRQIASHSPKHLIIFDIYENNAYAIEQELNRSFPKLKLTVLIGSVRDSGRVNQIFEDYKPEIIYHAAAHKHVPLMETSPNEAIKNNVIGTYKTAYAALKNGAQRFVLISTDKAVNPTNIMGASKRICEMVIQSMDVISRYGRFDLLPLLNSHIDDLEAEGAVFEANGSKIPYNENDGSELNVSSVKNKDRTGTQFVAVRFGNVLGSNGSVIPLFKKQIEEGGPVTVTHPDIIRYFMTIPEAVSLVLQAGAYAWGGEVFVLDMGAPVKIDTLARNLIRLSGYVPDVDIKICYTGLRKGEKLFEERLMAEEGMRKTDNDLIYIGKPVPFNVKAFFEQLDRLAEAAYKNSDNIVKLVQRIVPTFTPVGNNPTGDELKDSDAWKAENAEINNSFL